MQQLLRSDSEKAAAEAHAVKEAAGAYRKAKGRRSATALRALPAPSGAAVVITLTLSLEEQSLNIGWVLALSDY